MWKRAISEWELIKVFATQIWFIKMGQDNHVICPIFITVKLLITGSDYLTGVNVTLRFLARPSLVSLLAAGFVTPKPLVVSR